MASKREPPDACLHLPVQFEPLLSSSSVTGGQAGRQCVEVSQSPQQDCKQQITVLASGGDVDRWRDIGLTQGLTDDSDIAVFLITFYEKHKKAVGPATVCSVCLTPLPALCGVCSASSPQDSNSLQARNTLPASEDDLSAHFVRLQSADLGDHPSVSHGNHPSVSDGDHTPVSDGDHTPVSHGDHPSVSHGDHTPVSDGDYPVSHGDHPPVSVGDHTPVSDGDRPPVSHGDHPSVSDGDHPPVSHRDPEHSTDNCGQNCSTRKDKQKLGPASDRRQRINSKHRPDQGRVRTFQCQSCGASFKRRYSLKQHIVNCHKDTCPFLCQLCGQSCADSGQLHSHMRVRHTLFECSACSATFTNDVKFKTHVRTQHPGVKPHRCGHCDKSYTSQQSLVFHLRKVHSITPPQMDGILSSDASGRYRCQACTAVFHRQSLLKVHVASHGPHGHFRCNVCGLPCLDSEDWNRHALTHTPFQCPVCRTRFAHNTKYMAHMRAQHPGVKAHRCPHCDVAFDTRKWLAVHLLKHSGERPHLCPECGKSFTEAQVLQRHRLAMHQGARPYACSQCSKTFKTSSALAYHRRSHGGVKPFLCDECGKTFLCPSALSTHKKKCKVNGEPDSQVGDRGSHTADGSSDASSGWDQRRFVCPDCGTTFKGEQWLYRHRLNKPAACSKKFSCQFCPRVFKDNRNFVRHVRVHTGEKPFACGQCAAHFTTRSDLYRHSRTHSGVKPYTCQQCQMHFRFRCDLTTHLRTHSGETPYRCAHCQSAFISASQRLQHVRCKHKAVVSAKSVKKRTKEKLTAVDSSEDRAMTYSSGISNV